MSPLLRHLRNAAITITALAACPSSPTEPSTVTLSVQVSPGSLAIQAGSTGQATVTVSASGPNTGAITVSLASTPSGVSASFSPLSGPGNTTLSLTVDPSVAPGSYPLTIRAQAERASNTATTTFTLVVGPPPSFSLTLASSAINVTQGQSGTATVNVTRAGGFTGNVALALEGAPSGVTGSFNPNPASSTSSALSITVGSAVPAGTYSLTIRGTASGLATQTATLSLTVLPAQAPGFTLGLGAGLLTVTQGQSGTNAISITRTGGFTGNVNLALEGAPSGVTGTFNPNPASGTSSILTVNVGAAVAPGSYTLTVRGSTPSGAPGVGASAPELAADQTAVFTLTVAVAGGFTLSAGNVSVAQGAFNATTVSIIRSGGNTSNVTLALENAPAGVTGGFTPNGTTGTTSTLVLTVANSVPTGNYTLVVRGTADGLPAQATTFTLTVTLPGSFTLTASPTSLSVQAGASGTSTVRIARTNGFTGPVGLSHTTTAPAGVTVAFAPATVPGDSAVMTVSVAAGVAAGSYAVTVRGNAGGIPEQTTTVGLTVTPPASFSLALNPTELNVTQGQSGTATATLTRGGGFTGNVILALEGAPAGVLGTFAPNPATGNTSTLTLSVGATVAPGTYPLTVRGTASGLPERTATLSLTVLAGQAPGFTLALGSATATAAQGQSATNAVTLTRAGGFTGNVVLALEGAPTGVTGTFSPNPATGTSSTLTVNVGAATAPGTYTLTVRGSTPSGAPGIGGSAPQLAADQTATFSLTVTVAGGYSLAAANVTATQGTSGTASVTLTRTGGNTSNVTLALEGAPAGVLGTFAPNPATGNTSTLTLSVGATVAPGAYPLTVRGTADGLAAQTTTLTLTVLAAQAPGFTLALGSATVTAAQGQSATNAVTLTRAGGFTGNVVLALEGAPTGVTGTFSPNPATGTSSTLTVNVGAATAPGTYTLTVRGSTPSGAPGIGGSAPQLAADQTATFSLTVTVAGGYTLAATNTNVEQGGTGTSTITLTRTGGNTSNVTLALEGAPTGVTGSFAPAATNGANSTLTLTVAPSAAVGTSTLTVRGTADGLAAQTTTFTLTVTAPGNFSLAASPSSFTVQAGSAAVTSTITVTRTNGFAGSVAFTHTTTAPAGVTIAFVPTSTTGASVAMNITVGSGVAAGTYTITVKGNATGLAEQTATVSLTVTAPPGGGGNITWTYCPGVGVVPTWLAVQDGSGAWTRVTPTISGELRVYTFSVATRGGVAWVEVDETDGSADLSIMYGTTTELTNAGFACDGTGAVKTVNGTVAGVGLLASAFINLGGGGTAVNNPGTSWSIPNVSEGTVDLLATRSVIDPLNFAAGQVTDALVIRRNLNPAAGSTLPVINFDGAEKLTPERPTLTVTNPSGSMIALSSFQTANGEFGNLGFSQLGAAPYTYTAVPASGRISGDLHWLTLFSESGIPGASSGEYRSVSRIFSGAGAQSMTFGSSPPAVTYSNSITAPYLRPRAQFTNTAEYADLVFLGWANAGGRQNSVNVTIWEGYLTSLAVDYTLPDFSGVTGWSNLWGLESTDMQTQMSVTGWTSGGGPGQQPTVAGSVFYTAGRYTNPEVALRSLLRGPRPRR